PKLEWVPPIVKTSVVAGDGIDDLWEAVEGHRAHQEAAGTLEGKRRRRILEEVESMVALRLRARTADLLGETEAGLADDLAARRLDPYRAADILMRTVGAASEALVGDNDG